MVKAKPPVALIAGPTASGKSALALRLAEATGGAIVNADSAQIYRDLPILSARAVARTIGHAPSIGFTACSTARSPARRPIGRRWPRREIARLHGEGRLPILVGGTGLYLRTLLDGIAPIPPIDPEIRARGARGNGVAENLAELMPLDPVAATSLNPGDTTRIARALEVVRSTGRTLARMAAAARGRDRRRDRRSAAGPAPAPPLALRALRPAVRRDGRARRAGGGRGAAGARARPEPAGDAGDRRAPSLAPICAARLTCDQAIAAGQQATRNYAKRQYTWFAHQPPPEWPRFHDPLEGDAVDRGAGAARRGG